MRRRCHERRHHSYRDYGARGIRVDPRWRRSFAAFLEDVGVRPGPEFTLGRIDGQGGYYLGNVRWVSRAEQSRNLRSNRMLRYRGKVYCLAALAERYGLHPSTLASRLDRGWSLGRALTTPVKVTSRKAVKSKSKRPASRPAGRAVGKVRRRVW